jgi:glycosyltransferase involved in cell wall biosynthesis
MMSVHAYLRRAGYRIRYFVRRILFRLRGRVVHFDPPGTPRGTVLLSQLTLPFLNPDPSVYDTHTSRWECVAMVKEFLKRGYAVDVIDFENATFVPKKKYCCCIDGGFNLERLTPLLPKDCVKIFFIGTQHPKANNAAEQMRLDDFNTRHGFRASPERMLPLHNSAESADILLLLLGNTTTAETYAHIRKPMYRIPISTVCTYPAPDTKNWEGVRHSFVWIGGAGPIHKGVDLLIEAFKDMPAYTLHLCGKVFNTAMQKAYGDTLPFNIRFHNMISLDSDTFMNIKEHSLGILSASCAEGQSASTLVGMHAGLIPIVSKESGIDTHHFGITLQTTTIQSIQNAVRTLAEESEASLKERAQAAWKHVRKNHTRENFACSFSDFVTTLEKNYFHEQT